MALAGAVLAWAGAALAQEGWWNYDWPYRRSVTVADVPQTHLPGDEVGVVTMPTGGLTQRDAGDVRATTAGGEPVPYRVLMVGPGDVVRVAFALRTPHRKYFVYLGHASPPKAPEPLQIRRGVLLETWAYDGGGIATLRQVQGLFDRPGTLLGRDLVEQVFLGHNPFGPQNRTASLYTAWLVCPADGEYVFSTASQDASFLVADGTEVVSNGGLHRPQRRAMQQGRIRLTQGLHEVKVYHVSTMLDPVIVAAWQEPGGRRLWTIQPDAFAPVRRATPGVLERYGKSLHADFIPVHAGETFLAERYYQRYTFEARLAGQVAARPAVTWDFGDGQTSTEPNTDHVYLRSGQYKVTLSVKVAGEALTRTNRIFVTRPWDRVTAGDVERPAGYARMVAGYDWTAADDRDIAEAMLLFQRAGMPQAILRAGDALVKRDSARPEALRQAMPIYADALVTHARDLPRAVAVLAKAAEMTNDPAVGAAMTVSAGRAALKAGQPDKAMDLFEQTLKKYSARTTDESLRDARIGIGDVWRQRGRYDQALEAYQSARPAGPAEPAKQAVRKGDLARQAEDYLRLRQYADAQDALDAWENEFPTERLEGYSTLLRARLAMAQRQYSAAAALGEELLRVNPRSQSAPDLLMLAAEAYRSDRKSDPARQALQRVVEGYPESLLSVEAGKMLARSASAPASRATSRPSR